MKGEITYEPIPFITQDNYFSCAVYASNNCLLDITRQISKTLQAQFRKHTKFKYDYQIITINYKEDITFNKVYGNSEWQDSVKLEIFQGDVKEEIHTDIPIPRGNQVILSHYIETITFGSDFNTSKSAVEQTYEFMNTSRYFGVPIIARTMMFGDNKSVVTNATIPHSYLFKKHLALSYHKRREEVTSDMLNFFLIDGTNNPAYTMAKLWRYQKVELHLKALIPWQGDKVEIPNIIQYITHVQSRGE